MEIKGKYLSWTPYNKETLIEISPQELAEQLKPDISKIKEGDIIWVQMKTFGKNYKVSLEEAGDIVAHFPQQKQEEKCECEKPVFIEPIHCVCAICRLPVRPEKKRIERLEYPCLSGTNEALVCKINELIDDRNKEKE